MRILLIDDDTQLLEDLSVKMAQAGYTIDAVDDGQKGSYIARTNKYEAVLVDLYMRGKDGFTICKEIRESGIHVPIIFLSMESDSIHKIKALDLGADDYITKPFSFSELVARIKAVSRRPLQISKDVYELDDLVIDTDKQEVRKGGMSVYLTRKEYSLLECMAKKPGKVISRGEILEDAWGYDTNPFSNTIEAHIRNIRKKIGETKTKKYIQTVPGRGYKLDRNR